MRRRDLVIVGSVGAFWPRFAQAQAPERIRRIGVLHDYAETDREGQRQIAAFREELRKLGWADGGNLRIEYRSAAVDVELVRAAARQMRALKPDVILAAGATIVATVQRASHSIPIVFVNVTDP